MKIEGKLINLDDCKIEVIYSDNELPKMNTRLIDWLKKRIQEEHDAMRAAIHENGIRMHASARDAFHEVLKEVTDDKQ